MRTGGATAMTHEFDPGYRGRFATLCRNHPGEEVYPAADFRVEWGPVFHRGRLDGTARVLVIGQDPAAHESIARRILVGEAGQRVQGFLAKLGIDRSYVMVNAFLYSVYGQAGGERHKDDPAITKYRNRWLDAVFARSPIEAVVAFGRLADHAWNAWAATPRGGRAAVTYRAVKHPTYPESSSASGQTTKAEAMAKMLDEWNAALGPLSAAITHADAARPVEHYGATLVPGDLAPIPECDLPAGCPPWMRSVEAWASRQAVGEATGANATKTEIANAKRATVVVKIPRRHRTWLAQR